MIQGVIFDMDGLMFDTERIWATLWEPALAGLGLSYKEGLDEAARGTADDSMRAVLRRFYGPDCDPDRIIEALHEQGVIAFQAPPPKKPGLDEINHDDAKKITEQQIAKRKKYQKTSGENRKKKRVALREAAKTDPQAAAEYEALLQKNRERCRQYAQKKKLAQQELAEKNPLQLEPTDELKGESA